MRTGRTVAVLATITLSITAAMAQAQSANYRVPRFTVNGGGGPSTSASFRAVASLGQESVVATSASLHFVAQSGLWSFLGPGLAPVSLNVSHTTFAPSDPILSWTGNGADYQIHRSANCGTVLAGFLTSLPGLTYTDTGTPSVPLLCYDVLSTPRVLFAAPAP